MKNIISITNLKIKEINTIFEVARTKEEIFLKYKNTFQGKILLQNCKNKTSILATPF